MVLTDGALYVAEQCNAFWLMDAIASYQPEVQKHRRLKFAQFWTLTVNPDKSAKLECVEDSGIPPVVTQTIEYTDFELPELQLYCMSMGDDVHHTIMLPSEY